MRDHITTADNSNVLLRNVQFPLDDEQMMDSIATAVIVTDNRGLCLSIQ